MKPGPPQVAGTKTLEELEDLIDLYPSQDDVDQNQCTTDFIEQIKRIQTIRDAQKRAEAMQRLIQSMKQGKCSRPNMSKILKWMETTGLKQVQGKAFGSLLGLTFECITALDQFGPKENCGRWYKESMKGILKAAETCDSSKCNVIGGDPNKAGIFEKCWHDLGRGTSGVPMLNFEKLARNLRRKCTAMARKRKAAGLCNFRGRRRPR